MSLQSYLPAFYRRYEEMTALLATEDVALAAFYEAIPLLITENTLSKANEETIVRWQELLNLAVDGTLDQRRMVVQATLRGYGDLNEQKIHDIAAAFTQSSQSVVVDFTDTLLRVRVVASADGEVFHFEEIERALRPLIPAHLALSVERSYQTWRDILAPLTDWQALLTSYENWLAIKSILAEAAP